MKKTIFAFIIATILPLTAFAGFNVDLHYGSKGDDVFALQEFLTEQGVYTGPITGNFYALTLAGVKKFQSINRISPISGYFGPITRGVANSILDEPLALSEGNATITPQVIVPVVEPTVQSAPQPINQVVSQPIIVYQPAPQPIIMPPQEQDKSELRISRNLTPKIDNSDQSVTIKALDSKGKNIEFPVVKITVKKDGVLIDSIESGTKDYPYAYVGSSVFKDYGVQYNKSFEEKGEYIFTYEAYGLSKTETIVVE